ncbi:hypothetical protein evm_003640 [Chilo suppressalis]|nr:hypothetical protein evm_003640 [Chilo suppressalis]
MSQAFKRKSRAMSRVRSRSRSITPMRTEEATEAGRINAAAHSRRRLIMSRATASNTDPFVEPEPKLWKPSLQAFNVDRTPGGSLHMQTQSIDLMLTPQGSLRRKKELEQSIHIATLERAADMAIDEEEADDYLDHVRKWLDSSRAPPKSPEPMPSCSNPVFEENVNTNVAYEVSTFSPKDSMPVARDKTKEGSELDSDFDDEFNLDELTASLGQERNIPDEQDLDECQLQLVNNVTEAIDDAFEDLVKVSTDFVWDADFTTLKSAPETFTGPAPGPVDDFNTPLEAFESIWDRGIMELIVKETNRYASQKITNLRQNDTLKTSSRLHRWTETSVDEMYLFFGIYVLMGLDPRTSQHEYWKTTGFLEMPKFRGLLSYNRFILLGKFLHFVDNSDSNLNSPQNEGAIPAKLKKIAPIIQHLNTKFSSLYNLYPDIAIDESLTLFKGRLSWVQAIRTKAARFGIKSYELCESRTGYLYKFDIYTGKNSERDVVAPSADLAGKSAQVVLDLLKGLEHRGHCVTMDNFYNCPALARYLKGSLGFDCLGTLRPNRKHVPTEIAKAPKNLAKGTIIARHSGDVSCIAWKDTKMVCMICTYHNADTYVGRKAGKELIKPIVVRDYNNTMGGVDLKDQKLSMYLVERKRCVKWYAKIFKRLLNCSVLNAFVMLTGSLRRRNMPVLTHRDFREQLANCLVSKFNSSIQTISRPVGEITRLKRDILHVPQLMGTKNRAMCLICNRNGISKKVQLKCDTCDEFLCPGECWSDWHSLRNLPGRDIKVRKGARRN